MVAALRVVSAEVDAALLEELRIEGAWVGVEERSEGKAVSSDRAKLGAFFEAVVESCSSSSL